MIIIDASVLHHWSKNSPATMVEEVGGWGGVCEAYRPLISNDLGSQGPRVPALWLCGPKHTAGSVKSGAPRGRTAFALWIKYHCNTHVDIARHHNTKERLCRSPSNREERSRTCKVSGTGFPVGATSSFWIKNIKSSKTTTGLYLNDSVQRSYL